jgi:hypothetical protein
MEKKGRKEKENKTNKNMIVARLGKQIEHFKHFA